MCGIAGIVNSDTSRPVSTDFIRSMCDSLAHRGPDDFGHYVHGHVGLGMRRLSIIDLQTGDQPIPNEDKTIWIVFNGEIYNYQSLRTDLGAKGHRFRTTSDTEAIVHLYEELGTDCVHRLRGMFAFAIWDERQQTLLLARDRLGIKPLYYAQTAEYLLFGSELKALLTHPGVCRDIDPDAVSEYFTHSCVPGDLSIFKAIKKLPPGHVLTYRNGQVCSRRYWHIQPTPDDKPTEDEWVEQLQHYLQQAVQSHMVADVPLGAFLSGGLDSAAIVALMAKASPHPISTVTVGFSTEYGQFDERVGARTISKLYGTDHYECLLEPDVTGLLPKIVGAFDEPFADSSMIPNWLVCQETARHVKVALSGLGGDELFGGYERYLGLQLAESYKQLPRWTRLILQKLTENGLAGSGFSSWTDRVKRFTAASEFSLIDQYRSFITTFQDLREILHPDIFASLKEHVSRFDQVVSELIVCQPIDLGLFTDLYLYLPDDLLTLSDRVSMAHSLEVRVPFLDHELVEFAARIPAHFKIRGTRKKYLFRRAIAPWIPQAHFKRPKQGFSIPLAAWLRGPLGVMVSDLVESRECKESPWVNCNAIKILAEEHISGKRNHEVRLWTIICFLEWQRQYAGIKTAGVA